MDCTKCVSKGCRIGEPCRDRRELYVEEYHNPVNQGIIRAAALLVDDGRAGTMTRLEEITEYAKTRGYTKLGVAYCYGMEQEASLLAGWLRDKGFTLVMASCTVDGLTEPEIHGRKESGGVSCNPLGQAEALIAENVEFAILMGLCLGHDVLIQKKLPMDFTTWVVKDRVTGHRPLDALPGYKGAEEKFLENMDNSFHLMSRDTLRQKLADKNWQQSLAVLDLRGTEMFQKNGIPGSVQSLLTELPGRYRKILPDPEKEIVVLCNGGMQSLYAVMYLEMKGYHHVSSLSGGYGKFLEEEEQHGTES